jgi:hypothetical protein
MSKVYSGKPEPSLIYPSAIFAMAKIRRFGINKYGSSEDWRTTPVMDYYDAALRHILADLSGEEKDAESGESHLAHAMTNLMFLIEARYGKKEDLPVRYKSVK